MLFSSNIFIFIFLPITFFIYFYLNKKRLLLASKASLVFASLVFYSYWNINYLPLILVSILFNYVVGNMLMKSSSKSVLTFGILVNLSFLGYFKYMDFFISNINYIADTNFNLLHIVLPLGISFFTIQQITYLIDSYNKESEEYDFINYALFVSFFPQLIAGPIVHHKEMMPQFANIRNSKINYKNILRGIYVFNIGLFKKVVVADTFAKTATQGFDVAKELNFIEGWITSLSYTFQVYFDFSGYSDMAIGIALLFNIRLPINFNSPYKATNLQEFWQRWHMTLTRFLTEYLHNYIMFYIQDFFAQNKKGAFRLLIVTIIINFVIIGLWHGAAWTFVLFGLLNGIAISIYFYYKTKFKKRFKINRYLAILITFNLWNMFAVIFRAKSFDDAWKVYEGMFGFNGVALPETLEKNLSFLTSYGVKFGLYTEHLIPIEFAYPIHTAWKEIVYIIIAFSIVWGIKNTKERLLDSDKLLLNKYFSYISVIILVISIITMNTNSYTEFIYFKF